MPLSFPVSDQTFNVNSVDEYKDYLLHVKDNCPRFVEISEAAEFDPEVE